ncbi:hypothetical protein TNCV_451661 [Trichonephila clavipes]|nr:hypothetical protein TNCV_451661 [Trichonephila clavipes]
MLNSRPLVPLSSDLDDLNVLTPSHFLIGRSITSIVEPDLTKLNENRYNLKNQRLISFPDNIPSAIRLVPHGSNIPVLLPPAML